MTPLLLINNHLRNNHTGDKIVERKQPIGVQFLKRTLVATQTSYRLYYILCDRACENQPCECKLH